MIYEQLSDMKEHVIYGKKVKFLSVDMRSIPKYIDATMINDELPKFVMVEDHVEVDVRFIIDGSLYRSGWIEIVDLEEILKQELIQISHTFK